MKLPPLLAPELARIAPYEPGKPLEELERERGLQPGSAIKLASNENPLGPSTRALEAATRALAEMQLYPDGAAFHLREELAARHGVAVGQVSCGAGSNELIDLLVQAFVAPGEEVLAPAFSFACYRLSALAHRRGFRETPNGPRFQLDVEALLSGVGQQTRLVFLANPNNPTGSYLDAAGMRALVERLPPEIVLAIDEAYFEYVRAADFPDATRLLGGRERMVVLRTFSKIHGLAGLRVGYALGPAEIVDGINRVRLAFNVGSVAQAAARAALDDREHVERSRRLNAEQIEVVAGGLRALGLDPLPSQANFLLVDLGGRDGHAVFDAMLARGVIVRPVGSYGLPHHLRITIGTAAENQRMLLALAESL